MNGCNEKEPEHSGTDASSHVKVHIFAYNGDELPVAVFPLGLGRTIDAPQLVVMCA
jgi:hypothetical protein